MEGINSGAVSNQSERRAERRGDIPDPRQSDFEPSVAATWMKERAKNGVKLIVADPRRNELARHARISCSFTPDTDVALLNAMIHSIIRRGLVNEALFASALVVMKP